MADYFDERTKRMVIMIDPECFSGSGEGFWTPAKFIKKLLSEGYEVLRVDEAGGKLIYILEECTERKTQAG